MTITDAYMLTFDLFNTRDAEYVKQYKEMIYEKRDSITLDEYFKTHEELVRSLNDRMELEADALKSCTMIVHEDGSTLLTRTPRNTDDEYATHIKGYSKDTQIIICNNIDKQVAKLIVKDDERIIMDTRGDTYLPRGGMIAFGDLKGIIRGTRSKITFDVKCRISRDCLVVNSRVINPVIENVSSAQFDICENSVKAGFDPRSKR